MKLNAPMVPEPPYALALYLRFLKYVKQSGPNGCWWWIGGKDKDGYGKFKFKGHDLKAHRVSFAIFGGDLPEGFTVNHKKECLNRSCVNPAHLEAMPWGDNCADANRRRKVRLTAEYDYTEEPIEVCEPQLDVPYTEEGSSGYLPPYFHDDSPCPF